MKLNFKSAALFVAFISSSNAYAASLTINADGTGNGLSRVYDSMQVEVGSCGSSGCTASLATLPAGDYSIVAFPVEDEVAVGYSTCPGVALGNRCDISLSADETVTATFAVRSNFQVYDQDSDGIDDGTELALGANPFVADPYVDTDSDGLYDIIENNITHTSTTVSDATTCTGTSPGAADLTGQWDVRIIPFENTTTHTLADTIDSTQEYLAAFSICHTVENGLQIYFEDRFATGISFDGTTLAATFSDSGGDTILNATYFSGIGLYSKGRFEDLNFTDEGTPGALLRADRRMEKADLSNFTAANLSGVVGLQATAFDQATDQVLDRAYNPGSYGVEFRAIGTGVLTVDVYDEVAARGYFVPSVGTFFLASRYVDDTGLDLDSDGSFDDQELLNKRETLTYVEAPVAGVGGLSRGVFTEELFQDFNSDFVVDGGPIEENEFDLYGKGVSPSLRSLTLNIEKTDGSTVVRSRISLSNALLSAETVTLSGGNIPGDYVLVDNTDGNPATDTDSVLGIRNLVTGFRDGEKVGVHPSQELNGTFLVAKAEETGAGNRFNSGSYTLKFTGPGLSTPADDIIVSHTNHNATPLPYVTNIRLNNVTLQIDNFNTRLINSDVSHTLSWNDGGPSGLSGSTGASLYRIRIRNDGRDTDAELGLDVDQLEIYSFAATDCSGGACSIVIPQHTFDLDRTYTIDITAFDSADSSNRSFARNRYVSAASVTSGCSNNTNNQGRVTNGSPCAEYYKVANPRQFGGAGDTSTSLDYAVNRPAGTPKALVVLFAGGKGAAGVVGSNSTNVTKRIGGNFLVRSANMFADAGYLTLTLDRPSDETTDISSEFDTYRISPRHAHDIALAIREVNTENLNVFLVGTSRGAISVVNQYALGTGISLSVPVNTAAAAGTAQGGFPVGFGTNPGDVSYPEGVTVPVHYLENPDETCVVTAPTTPGDTTMFDRFTGLDTGIYGSIATTNLFDSVSTISNGVLPLGNDCAAFHYHGFIGSESTAADTTTAWLDGIVAALGTNNAPRVLPVRRLALPSVSTAINTSSFNTFDLDGDAISFELAHNTSSRGGSVSIAGSTITYTPPASNNITDGFVVIAVDGNGGRTSMLVTIDVSDDADTNGLPDSIYPGADATSDDDNDGLTLLEEYQAGTNPTAGGGDTDGDGLNDKYELDNSLDPTSANGNDGASADPDNDGFTNVEEATAGSLALDSTSNPGFIQFAGPIVDDEAIGTSAMVVTRTGGSVGAVSVNCFTNDSAVATTATSVDDYTSLGAGTLLNWADNDATSKDCDITIIDDADVETNEDIQVDLSSPSGGAKLGAVNSTLLTITDNDVAAPTVAINDFNGDVKSDIPLYRSDNGGVRIWEMNGGNITANTYAGALGTNFQIQGFADTNADGNADVIWFDANTGAVRIWLMNGGTVTSDIGVGSLANPWVPVEIGDFNNDNQADILWHRPDTGDVRIWLLDNGTLQSNNYISALPTSWEIRGLADVNNDGQQDIVWRNANNSDIRIWQMSGATLTANGYVGGFANTDWTTSGLGDFNNDGNDDILFTNTNNGAVRIWEMNGVTRQADRFVSVFPTAWKVQNIGDYNNDGTDDILWQHSTNGGMRLWPMANSNLTANTFIGTYNDTDWKLKGHGDYDGGGTTDILWQNPTTGSVRMWLMDGDTVTGNLFVGLISTYIAQP